MRARKLGSQGLEVSILGLGCMGMSDFYSGRSEKAAEDTLLHAIDLGISFFDTADMYGVGHNELLLGRVLRPQRDKLNLATKFGHMRGADGQFLGINGRPDYVRACCEASLKRLGVEYIDLYYQHRVDPNVAIEETVGAMSELVQAGKIRYIGLCEVSTTTLRRAHAVHPISAVQSEYSLWSRDPEAEILPLLQTMGIGFVPYSPLGRGFLTGRIRSVDDLAGDDYRRNSPRFQEENLDRNLELLNAIEDMARSKGCSMAQLALAWVLAQGDHIVPIPGTRSLSRLEENVAALQIELTTKDLEQLNAMIPVGAASGTRYPALQMQALNR